jgi:glutamyl-tRNA(Gln) amidotransferase subunit D
MAKEGDRVQIVTKDETIEGILLPEEKGFTVVKLSSGYNIGIDQNRIQEIKLIEERAEKKFDIKKILKKEELPTISILHTGGTIASKVDYETGGVISRFTPEEILQLFPELHEIANIDSRLVANMASDDIRFEHYNMLADAVAEEIKKGVDGIIITHGTDTLHYSSAALSFVLQNLPVPLILVGSQRSSDRGSSDAGINLISAARFIANSDYAGVGVCMHETIDDDNCLILEGTKCRKMHSSRRDSFKPVNSAPIARVNAEDSSIKFFKVDYPKKSTSELELKKFNTDLKVGLMYIHPNMYSEQFEFYKDWDGLVLAGTGLGHAPITESDEVTKEHAKILQTIEAMRKKVKIVMTTQTIYGRVQMDVYAPGRKLLDLGIIGSELDMHPETAFVKLAWVLSNYEGQERDKAYLENIAGEVSERLEPGEFLWQE